MIRALLAAAVGLASLPPAAAADGPPALDMPLRCTAGETCWISNHVDLDPGPGARDYRCGDFTYDDHNGTDFALRDRRRMEEGVDVLAAAPGIVVGGRDGMADRGIDESDRATVAGRECGNGVLIDHGGGWQTQYCHMRENSIAVRPGDRVEAGQTLGKVGLSGLTEYPHLHFIVRHGDGIVDPFLGPVDPAACGADAVPLWRPEVARALPYAPGVVFDAGFAGEAPDWARVRDGQYRDAALPATAPVLALFAEVFATEPGDEIALRILGPAGDIVTERRERIEKRQARIFRFIGKRRKQDLWPTGRYRGEIVYRHAAATLPDSRREATVEVR